MNSFAASRLPNLPNHLPKGLTLGLTISAASQLIKAKKHRQVKIDTIVSFGVWRQIKPYVIFSLFKTLPVFSRYIGILH